jgi:Rad3-related DNA helicase
VHGPIGIAERIKRATTMFNEVDTKDLCLARYSPIKQKVFYFVALKFVGLPDHIVTDYVSTLPAPFARTQARQSPVGEAEY